MAKTLTKEDLQAISETLQPVIEKTVDHLITKEVKPMIDDAVGELAIITNNAIHKESEIMRSEMATKQDIQVIRGEMATKEDLKQYASKYDLQDAVTDIKDEIRPISANHEKRLTKLEERILIPLRFSGASLG